MTVTALCDGDGSLASSFSGGLHSPGNEDDRIAAGERLTALGHPDGAQQGSRSSWISSSRARFRMARPVEAVRRGPRGVDSARETANPASLERSPPELDTGTGPRGRERRRARRLHGWVAEGGWTSWPTGRLISLIRVDLLCPHSPYSWVASTAEQHRPRRRAGSCPHGPRTLRLLSARRDMLYPAAHDLGIVREFAPGPDPRSREQQANLLCDDDAELLVILGVEVDAVGVA